MAVGNPEVNPEKADTLTLGAIYRPGFDFLNGLQFSVDYYSVNVKDAIGQLGVQNITTFCFQGQTTLCQYVERDPQAGTLTRVLNPYLNIAEVKVKGIDFEAQYLTRPQWLGERAQTLSVRTFARSPAEALEYSDPWSPEQRLDGGFDQNNVNGPTLYPRWKANFALAYTMGPVTAQISEEWISRSRINVTWVEAWMSTTTGCPTISTPI